MLSRCVQDMSHVQMNMEKTSLQTCLLHFESLHGRPVGIAPTKGSICSSGPSVAVNICVSPQSTRQEWTLVQPFYERYRLLKHLLLSSAATVITTIVSNSRTILKDDVCVREQCEASLCMFNCTVVPPAGQKQELHTSSVCKMFLLFSKVNYGSALHSQK